MTLAPHLYIFMIWFLRHTGSEIHSNYFDSVILRLLMTKVWGILSRIHGTSCSLDNEVFHNLERSVKNILKYT